VVPRFPESVAGISVAYLGLQHPPDRFGDQAAAAQAWLIDALRASGGPSHHERSEFRDRAGFSNALFACYWMDDGFEAWWRGVGERWTRDESQFPDIGRFVEVFQPSVDRFEGITDGVTLRGIARLSGRMSGPVREQGYWGSMRDRLPRSQTDGLAPAGAFSQVKAGTLVSVQAPANLCIIVSGQDWSGGEPDEQAGYIATIEPTMKASMDLLDSEGLRFGCFCNRYAWVQDADGRPTAATFGMSIWRGLAQLEQWGETHFTHLASYVGAAAHYQRFGKSTRLSRYHEVFVPAAEQARFEYRNCHGLTGVLEASAA
jgi:aldoxime dehydratase